jgi:membrane protease subunit (stomatin/prohibitin family)
MFSFKVEDPAVLLKEVFGTNKLYTVAEIESQLKNYIVSEVSDAIAESGISALDLAGYYSELGDIIKKRLAEKFSALGLAVATVTVENISLPAEVEKSVDTRSSLGILGDKLGAYTQLKSANAIEEAAKNPAGSGLAGAGVGLGAGFAMADMMKGAMSGAEKSKKTCPDCGAEIGENARFCPECGKKLNTQKTCAKCGAKLAARAKFCPECGEKVGNAKCECGAELSGEKFCPECGKKQG